MSFKILFMRSKAASSKNRSSAKMWFNSSSDTRPVFGKYCNRCKRWHKDFKSKPRRYRGASTRRFTILIKNAWLPRTDQSTGSHAPYKRVPPIEFYYIGLTAWNQSKLNEIRSYKKHYSAYIRKSLGKMQLSDIRAEHIQKLLNNMSSAGYAEDTITLTYCTLSGVFKQVFKSELIPKNPFVLVTKPKGKGGIYNRTTTPLYAVCGKILFV